MGDGKQAPIPCRQYQPSCGRLRFLKEPVEIDVFDEEGKIVDSDEPASTAKQENDNGAPPVSEKSDENDFEITAEELAESSLFPRHKECKNRFSRWHGKRE